MSEIKFNSFGENYGFYKKPEEAPKQDAKQEQPLGTHQGNAQSVAPEKVLDAMDVLGAQNFASVANKNQINPLDFLSEDRIASIEDSMKLFEDGVEKYAGTVKEEFGAALGDKTVYALAAEAFANNN